MMTSPTPQIALGVAVAVVLHFYHGGWWLDAGQRVLATLVAVAVITVFVGATWRKAVAFGAGVVGGMTGILFVIGPGSIFPIVIAIGSTMIAIAVFVGWCAGWSARLALSWLRPKPILQR
jgi:hypothetical protein